MAQSSIDRKYIIRQTDTLNLKKLVQTQKLLRTSNKLGEIFKKTIKNYRGKTGYFSGLNKNGEPVYDFDDNIDAAITSQINLIRTNGNSGLELNGLGIEIGQWKASGRARNTHQELKGKVYNGESELISRHATHTACTMVGTGINGKAKGMAPSATIIAYNTENAEEEITNFEANGGILSNHSYGTGNPDGKVIEYGLYSEKAALWDEIMYSAPFLLMCKSAGNEQNDEVNTSDGGYDVLFTVSVSKNPLVIGAVDDVAEYFGPESVQMSDFSSWGPTDDWRIKPDLIANGVDLFSAVDDSTNAYKILSGSSMATAVTSGTIALLQQYFHSIHSHYMKSSTVKALLICTSDELGSNPGPDFRNGWGLFNAKSAADVISQNGLSTQISELSLSNGEAYTTEIETDGNSPQYSL